MPDADDLIESEREQDRRWRIQVGFEPSPDQPETAHDEVAAKRYGSDPIESSVVQTPIASYMDMNVASFANRISLHEISVSCSCCSRVSGIDMFSARPRYGTMLVRSEPRRRTNVFAAGPQNRLS